MNSENFSLNGVIKRIGNYNLERKLHKLKNCSFIGIEHKPTVVLKTNNMVEPRPDLPADNLNSQFSISNGILCLMLDTATTQAEIGRSWEAISNDIDIVEAYDLARQNEQVRN